MKQVLIYLGFFNPIYSKQMDLVRRVQECYHFDSVIFQPISLSGFVGASDEGNHLHPIKMCELAGQELALYGINTCCSNGILDLTTQRCLDAVCAEQKNGFGDVDVSFLIDSDSMDELHAHQVANISFDGFKVLLALNNRNGFDKVISESLQGLSEKTIFDFSSGSLSSAEIRKHFAAYNYSDEICIPVLGYIWKNNLYGSKWNKASLKDIIRPLMKESRYIHSLNVQKMAVNLAEKFGGNCESAYIAGTLHDICKYLPNDIALNLIHYGKIKTNINFQSQPQLLHGFAGSIRAIELGIEDIDIINAIRYHTTGRANMTKLEKIVYLADLVSEDRHYPDVEHVREICYNSLEDGMDYALRYMVEEHLKNDGNEICDETMDAYRCYVKKEFL